MSNLVDISSQPINYIHNGSAELWRQPGVIFSNISTVDPPPTTKNLLKTTKTPLPHIVYFVPLEANPVECTEELSNQIGITWSIVHTWSDMSRELQAGHRILSCHASIIEQSQVTPAEFVDAIQTIIKFMPDSDFLRIGVVVNKKTNIKTVNQLRKTRVVSLCLDLNDFSPEDAIIGVRALVANIQHWPKHIIDQLAGQTKKEKKLDSIELTDRQEEVLNLILTRGASNKIIARTLNITESTVKLHISSILKKYGVKNRTQLAVFALKK